MLSSSRLPVVNAADCLAARGIHAFDLSSLFRLTSFLFLFRGELCHDFRPGRRSGRKEGSRIKSRWELNLKPGNLKYKIGSRQIIGHNLFTSYVEVPAQNDLQGDQKRDGRQFHSIRCTGSLQFQDSNL